MKVLIENHNNNDKIKREQAAETEKKIYEKNHNITCSHCGALLYFFPENIKFNKFDWDPLKNFKGSAIICPCCNHSIEIPKEIAKKDYSCYSNDNNRKIQVLKEGNFQIEKTCDNCESTFAFDYRDTFLKDVIKVVYNYFWEPNHITEKELFVKCPICGKEHPVN